MIGAFAFGLVIGSTVGVTVMALLIAHGRREKQLELAA